jgi:hypothetical protein
MGSALEKWPALAKGLDQIPTGDASFGLVKLEAACADEMCEINFNGYLLDGGVP